MVFLGQRIVGKFTSPMDAMGFENNQSSNEKNSCLVYIGRGKYFTVL